MTAAVPAPRPPRPSATLLVVRPAEPGFEVLLMRRADKGDHNSNAWVFPGGLVDRADRDAHPFCTGLDDRVASARLGLPEGGLDYYVAAIRETFEEAALLFAVDVQGRLPATADPSFDRLAALRGPLARGEIDMASLCRDHGLRITADRLHYVAHWITPAHMAKRFDTRFFLALLPQGQEAGHDAVELLEHGWFRPSALLQASEARKLMVATLGLLELLAGFGSLQSLMDWAASAPPVRTVLRRRAMDASGSQVLMPDHPAWPEVGLLDPDGAGTAWCELAPGRQVRLAPGVLRLTHEAGNTYLVGDAGSGWLAIDAPGSGEAGTQLLGLTGGQAPTLAATSADTPVAPLHAGPHVLVPMPSPRGTAWLLAGPGLLFTGDWLPTPDELPEPIRGCASWAAPRRGFLVPLR